MTYGNSATWTCLVSVVFPIPCVFSTLACRWHSVILNHGPINAPILLKIGIGLTVFGTPAPKLDQLTTNLRLYPVELKFVKIKWPNASQDAVNWFLTYGVWTYDQISSWFEHVWMAGIQIPNMGQGICTEIKWIQTRSYRLYLEACFPSRCFLHLLIHVSFWRISCRYFTSTIARIQLWHCNQKGSSTKSPLTKAWNYDDRYVRRNDLLATLLFEAPQAPSCMSWPRLRRKPVAGTQASCQKKPNMSQADLWLYTYFILFHDIFTCCNPGQPSCCHYLSFPRASHPTKQSSNSSGTAVAKHCSILQAGCEKTLKSAVSIFFKVQYFRKMCLCHSP